MFLDKAKQEEKVKGLFTFLCSLFYVIYLISDYMSLSRHFFQCNGRLMSICFLCVRSLGCYEFCVHIVQ